MAKCTVKLVKKAALICTIIFLNKDIQRIVLDIVCLAPKNHCINEINTY